jgi:2',3'-cyclic-nucleotide 2'-phosphodiesterase (5'-nucleotidase family)
MHLVKPSLAKAFLLSILSLSLAAQAPRGSGIALPVTDALADDVEVQKVITPLAAEIKASFGLPLVEAPEGLFRGRRGEENRLGYWLTDVMRQAAQEATGTPVKFAITNQGGIRANLHPGQLKVGDIFEVMPFENELVVVELTGAEVIQVVKEGILHRGGEPCSGVKVVVSGTPTAASLLVTWEDGSPIKPDEPVKVATSDYLYSGGDSIPTLKKGRHPFTTGITLRQVLLDACAKLAKQKRDLTAPPTGRMTVPPEIQEAIRAKQFKF